MLKKITNTLFRDISTLNNRTIFLLISLLAFFIRLPFFFRDYIDRDESTFILMGQSWVNGHLPYTELWDLKPPLVYFFFATLIYVFGKSFIAIRLAGVLVVAVTAFFTFAIGKKLHSVKLGWWAAVCCVYLLSLIGSLQGVMSEHLSMFYFMPALYFLVVPGNWLRILLSGLLMGLAVMTKINLAYAVLFLGAFLLFEGIRDRRFRPQLWKSMVFGLGILTVVLFTWLPYYLSGQFGLWWNSVVLAPLEYSEARRSSFFKLAPIVLLIAAFLFISFKKNWLPVKDRAIQILCIALIGVILSFIKGGRINGHYLIQFHPIFLLLLGLVLGNILPGPSPRWQRWIIILLLIFPLESYKEYYDVARYRLARGTYFNGEGFTVPAYLKQKGLDKRKTFFLEYHIGYWLLAKLPPTRAATHPSNLCRDELFKYYGNPRKSSLEELSYIMNDFRPEIVVTRFERRIFDESEEEENSYMTAYLQQHYRVIALVDGAEIHQRSD